MRLLLLLCAISLTACLDMPGPDAAWTGRWTVTRTAAPTTGCPTIALADLSIDVAWTWVDDDDHHRATVDDGAIELVTFETIDGAPDTWVRHTMHWVEADDTLVGTGVTDDTAPCSYQIALHGERAP